MPRFRKKPEIVDAYEIPDRDLWIIKHQDGSETQLKGEEFRQSYERVSDNYRVQPLAIDHAYWDGQDRRTAPRLK